MTYFEIFSNVHLNIIISRKLFKIFNVFIKRRIKKVVKLFLKKITKKLWSKGADVAPYNMVGLHSTLLAKKHSLFCRPFVSMQHNRHP
jgi:hypothetical protein